MEKINEIIKALATENCGVSFKAQGEGTSKVFKTADAAIAAFTNEGYSLVEVLSIRRVQGRRIQGEVIAELSSNPFLQADAVLRPLLAHIEGVR